MVPIKFVKYLIFRQMLKVVSCLVKVVETFLDTAFIRYCWGLCRSRRAGTLVLHRTVVIPYGHCLNRSEVETPVCTVRLCCIGVECSKTCFKRILEKLHESIGR
jgi:hypothetical protein